MIWVSPVRPFRRLGPHLYVYVPHPQCATAASRFFQTAIRRPLIPSPEPCCWRPMRVDLFDFDLPESSIALRPPQPRDAGRMLVVRPGEALEDRAVRDLAGLLRPGDALVFNDTRVIPARLHGIRHRSGSPGLRMEAMLHLREATDRWRAFARPGKRLAIGDRVSFGRSGQGAACSLGVLDATITEKGEGGEIVLRFDLSGPALDEAIVLAGELPLPPLHRGQAQHRRAGRGGLPDGLCPAGRRRCRPHRGPTFLRRPPGTDRRRRHPAPLRDAACGGGHIPAGQGRRYRPPSHACRDRLSR